MAIFIPNTTWINSELSFKFIWGTMGYLRDTAASSFKHPPTPSGPHDKEQAQEEMKITLTRLAMVGFQSLHVESLVLPKASPEKPRASETRATKKCKRITLSWFFGWFNITFCFYLFLRCAMHTCGSVEPYSFSIMAGEKEHEAVKYPKQKGPSHLKTSFQLPPPSQQASCLLPGALAA